MVITCDTFVLFKVIPRKDLPRIYTMCLPPSYQAASSGDQSADEQHTLGQGLADLERTREEVVKEVSSDSMSSVCFNLINCLLLQLLSRC